LATRYISLWPEREPWSVIAIAGIPNFVARSTYSDGNPIPSNSEK